jgi:hypothetical protein
MAGTKLPVTTCRDQRCCAGFGGRPELPVGFGFRASMFRQFSPPDITASGHRGTAAGGDSLGRVLF